MKANKKLTAFLLALVLATSLFAGCAQKAPDDKPPAASTERTVTDMAGRTVVLPAEIKTIGTFGSIGVLNAFIETMGEGDKLANEGSPSFVSASSWEKYQYRFTPQIKNLKPFQGADLELLMENILAAKPDLCLTMTPDLTEALEEQGLNVIQLSWQQPEEVKECITLLGEVLNAQDIAKDYLEYFNDMVAEASELTKSIKPEDKVKVLYGTVTTFTQPHVIAEWWIDKAGGASVTSEALLGSGEEKLVYTLEDVLLWNPDVIFVMAEKEKNDILADSRLSDITAVKNGAIYIVPRVAHTWGNRTTEQPLTIMWALNKLYPELLTKEALTEDIKYFYSHFFNCEFSDEEISEIIG